MDAPSAQRQSAAECEVIHLYHTPDVPLYLWLETKRDELAADAQRACKHPSRGSNALRPANERAEGSLIALNAVGWVERSETHLDLILSEMWVIAARLSRN